MAYDIGFLWLWKALEFQNRPFSKNGELVASTFVRESEW